MAGKVKLNSTNKITEGILGDDDYTPVLTDRGFSDRSIGDEFFRTGRNSGTDIIENPESSTEDELSDDDFEDMGYDYDGGEEAEDDEAYTQHSTLRDQLYRLDQRLLGIESMLGQLFGSQGTVMNPLSDDEFEDDED